MYKICYHNIIYVHPKAQKRGKKLHKVLPLALSNLNKNNIYIFQNPNTEKTSFHQRDRLRN